jgi:hypothetical protein
MIWKRNFLNRSLGWESINLQLHLLRSFERRYHDNPVHIDLHDINTGKAVAFNCCHSSNRPFCRMLHGEQTVQFVALDKTTSQIDRRTVVILKMWGLLENGHIRPPLTCVDRWSNFTYSLKYRVEIVIYRNCAETSLSEVQSRLAHLFPIIGVSESFECDRHSFRNCQAIMWRSRSEREGLVHYFPSFCEITFPLGLLVISQFPMRASFCFLIVRSDAGDLLFPIHWLRWIATEAPEVAWISIQGHCPSGFRVYSVWDPFQSEVGIRCILIKPSI